jgi:UDP-glucose 4-epimerase
MEKQTAPRVVVVTGVSRFLGAQIAAQIADDPRVERVVGLDRNDPPDDYRDLLRRVELRKVDFTRGGGNTLAKLKAEAVVHLAVISSPDGISGGRAAMKEQNVIGTMHLLAGCQATPTLRRLVVRSSTAAYGASFRDPAVFTEDAGAKDVPRGGYGRDILDIEGYVRGFQRRRPDVTGTVLRFAPFAGPTAETQLLRYFAQRVVPTVLGRDPRLQFVHVDDALEIVRRSVVEDHPGTFNVAGPGVITLAQAVRRAGRIGLPVIETFLQAATRLGGVSLDQVDLFVHGRVVDTSRLSQEFGFTPRSTTDAFDDFLKSHQNEALVTPDLVDRFLKLIGSVRRGLK